MQKITMADPYEKLTSDVYTEYQKRLLKNNSLDFDDLIMTTIQLFERVPEVLEFYQRKFQYIHVDEYQDTNKAQYLLVKHLAARFKIFVLWVTLTSLFIAGVVQIFLTFCHSKRL